MRKLVAAALFLSASLTAFAQGSPQTTQLSPETAQQVADIANNTLKSTGVPSAFLRGSSCLTSIS